MANGALDQGMPPQGGPQAPPQGAPGPQAPPQGGPPAAMSGELYPKDKKELQTFATNILKLLYEEADTAQEIVKGISSAATVEAGIVNVVSTLLLQAFSSIRNQKQRDINTEFVDEMIVVMVREMYQIAKSARLIEQEPDKSVVTGVYKETMQKILQGLQSIMQGGQPPGPQGQAEPPGPPQGGGAPAPLQGQPQPPSALGA